MLDILFSFTALSFALFSFTTLGFALFSFTTLGFALLRLLFLLPQKLAIHIAIKNLTPHTKHL